MPHSHAYFSYQTLTISGTGDLLVADVLERRVLRAWDYQHERW